MCFYCSTCGVDNRRVIRYESASHACGCRASCNQHIMCSRNYCRVYNNTQHWSLFCCVLALIRMRLCRVCTSVTKLHLKKVIGESRLRPSPAGAGSTWRITVNNSPMPCCRPISIMWKHDVIHKPEVHDILPCRQRRTEPWPQGVQNISTCGFWDTWAERQTDKPA